MSDITKETLEYVARLAGPQVPSFKTVGSSDVPSDIALAHVYHPHGLVSNDVTAAILKRMPTPRRRTGHVTLYSPLSLVDFVVRNFDKHKTVLFADTKRRVVTSILNYHEPTPQSAFVDQVMHEIVGKIEASFNESSPGKIEVLEDQEVPATPEKIADADADKAESDTAEERLTSKVFGPFNLSLLPQWGDFRAVYEFPLSRQWQTWSGFDGKLVDQAELAQFFEDNIRDVADPDTTKMSDSLKLLVHRLNLHLGSPSRLLEVARGMELKSTEKFRSAVNTDTGEQVLVYEQEHAGGGNTSVSELRVPTAFLLSIPVFTNDAPYLLLCRLRYRKVSSTVKWLLNIQGAEAALEDAFERGCTIIADGTKAPLFYGVAPDTAAPV